MTKDMPRSRRSPTRTTPNRTPLDTMCALAAAPAGTLGSTLAFSSVPPETEAGRNHAGSGIVSTTCVLSGSSQCMLCIAILFPLRGRGKGRVTNTGGCLHAGVPAQRHGLERSLKGFLTGSEPPPSAGATGCRSRSSRQRSPARPSPPRTPGGTSVPRTAARR